MKVTYIDHMGSDLSVVNAARVSFAKKSKGLVCTDRMIGTYELSDADKSLIHFLARGCTEAEWNDLKLKASAFYDIKEFWELEDILNHIRRMPPHWTPFGHTAITLHVKAPIFVARQLGKHQTGFVWNEVSRRYVTDDPEFYIPKEWRQRADNVKQGSSPDKIVRDDGWYPDDLDTNNNDWSGAWFPWGDPAMQVLQYRTMLAAGVCPEQARMVLPQSMYTEWYWTGNLYAWANMYVQRTDPHTQKETQTVAQQVGKIIEPLFPESWKALTQ